MVPAGLRIEPGRRAHGSYPSFRIFANDPGVEKICDRRQGVPVHGRAAAARPPARLSGHGRRQPDPVPLLLDPVRPRCPPRARCRPTRRAAWLARRPAAA